MWTCITLLSRADGIWSEFAKALNELALPNTFCTVGWVWSGSGIGVVSRVLSFFVGFATNSSMRFAASEEIPGTVLIDGGIFTVLLLVWSVNKLLACYGVTYGESPFLSCPQPQPMPESSLFRILSSFIINELILILTNEMA